MKWTFWTRTQPAIPDDCGTIDPLLSLYADSMASAEEARRVEMHLPDCAACRESLAWMQATQRALAARPVVSPPTNLRARIAEAIAASSAAPVQARPARAFVLRPAFAAAASLTVLGVVVGYGLLHMQAPPTAKKTPVVTPPVAVAVAPPVSPSAPIVKTMTGVGVKPHVAHHPSAVSRPARLNPDRMAQAPPDEAQPEPMEVKTPAEASSRTKQTETPAPMIAPLRTRPVLVKKLVLPKFKPEMTAIKAPVAPVETHRPPVVQPEPRKPETIVATIPHDPPASVPVSVGVPSIKPDPAPAVVVARSHESHFQAADFLGPVKEHLGRMRNVAYTSAVRRSVKGASLATRSFDSDKTAYVPGVYTP